ncbi:MAG: hypothetical protein IKY53_01425 [Lachnospiraceae bacterium]|nr:hypothetical protein [Lachnospiraceae bacterium]
MNQNNKKGGIRAIVSFVILLLIAIVCFGISGFIYSSAKGTAPVDDSTVELLKIAVLAGIFFLILAFGYALRMIINGKKSQGGTVPTGEHDICNEANMRIALEKYIPEGESLVAAIRTVTKESFASCVFDKCVLTENDIRPAEDGKIISVSKKKVCTYDMYLGITERSMVVADCSACKYFYEFNKVPVSSNIKIQTITEPVSLGSLCKCFALEDVESCKVKKGMLGSLNCVITMKNGDYFKLMIPKAGSFGGGMPHHEEYRDLILQALRRE